MSKIANIQQKAKASSGQNIQSRVSESTAATILSLVKEKLGDLMSTIIELFRQPLDRFSSQMDRLDNQMEGFSQPVEKIPEIVEGLDTVSKECRRQAKTMLNTGNKMTEDANEFSRKANRLIQRYEEIPTQVEKSLRPLNGLDKELRQALTAAVQEVHDLNRKEFSPMLKRMEAVDRRNNRRSRWLGFHAWLLFLSAAAHAWLSWPLM